MRVRARLGRIAGEAQQGMRRERDTLAVLADVWMPYLVGVLDHFGEAFDSLGFAPQADGDLVGGTDVHLA